MEVFGGESAVVPGKANFVRARWRFVSTVAILGAAFFITAGCVMKVKQDAESVIKLSHRMRDGMPEYNRGDELSDSDGDGQADAFDRYPFDADSVLFPGDRLVKSVPPKSTKP